MAELIDVFELKRATMQMHHHKPLPGRLDDAPLASLRSFFDLLGLRSMCFD